MRALLWAVAGATLLSFDLTAVGPFMVSQPMVAGPLMGWWLGHTVVGVIIGGIVQLIWMDVTPVGVGIPYDATSTTLLAVYLGCLEPHASLSQMAVALFVAVPFGFVFKYLDTASRRINTLLTRMIEYRPDSQLGLSLDLGIASGLVWYAVRYAVGYAVIFAGGHIFWRYLAYVPGDRWIDQGWRLAIVLLPVAGMGVALELFLSDEPERRWAKLRQLTGGRRKP